MAYIDIATADALLAYRTTWAPIAAADKQIALENATRYLDTLYGSVYIGTISSSTQDNLWPRTAVLDNYGQDIPAGTIPERLQQATAEAAFLSATGSVLLPMTVSSGGSVTSNVTGGIKKEKVRVGSLETETEYTPTSSSTENTAAVQLATEQGVPLIPMISSLVGGLITELLTTNALGSNYRIIRS